MLVHDEAVLDLSMELLRKYRLLGKSLVIDSSVPGVDFMVEAIGAVDSMVLDILMGVVVKCGLFDKSSVFDWTEKTMADDENTCDWTRP